MNTKAIAILGGKVALAASITFFLGRCCLLFAGLQISGAADWLFRLIIVAPIVIGVVALKGRQKGYLNFAEGFKLGGLITVFLAIFMSIAIWGYMHFVQPSYPQEYEQTYRDFHYARMMRDYIGKTWEQDTITQGAIDTVNNGLDKNIDRYTGHLFTVSGQVQSTFMYSIFWGIFTTLAVVVMARKSEE